MPPFLITLLALTASFGLGAVQSLLRMGRRDDSAYAIAFDLGLAAVAIYFFAAILSPYEALGRFFLFTLALSFARLAGNRHGERIRTQQDVAGAPRG